MILSTANLKNELYMKIMTRFEDNPVWKEFIQSIHWKTSQQISQCNEEVTEQHCMIKLYEALQYTYTVNWTEEFDYISPSCFMYLLDCLLLLTSCGKGFIFATKSSFVEWLSHCDENSLSNLCSMAGVQPQVEYVIVHKFIYAVLRDLLYGLTDTINWIRKSNLDVKYYLPLFVLRLVVSVCLLHLSSGSGQYLEFLRNLLGKNHVISQLPQEFCDVLQKGKEQLGLKVIAEAFKMIDNPLVVARFSKNSSKIVCPDAVHMDLTVCQRKLILQALFPDRIDSVDGETAAVVEASDSMTKEFPSTNCFISSNKSSGPVSDQTLDSGTKCDINMSMDVDYFWIMLENLWLTTDESKIDDKVFPNSVMVKNVLNAWIEILSCSICGSLSQNPVNLENKNEMEEVVSLVDEMKQLSFALTLSGDAVIENHILVNELSKRILSRRPKVGHVLNQLYLLCMKNSNVEWEPSLTKTTTVL